MKITSRRKFDTEHRVAAFNRKLIDYNAAIWPDFPYCAFSLKNIFDGVFQDVPDTASESRIRVRCASDLQISLTKGFHNFVSLFHLHVYAHCFGVAPESGLDLISVL